MTRTRKVARKRGDDQNDQTDATAQAAQTNTADDATDSHDAALFAENMSKAMQLWQQIMQRLSLGYLDDPSLSFGHTDPFNIAESFLRMAGRLAANPYQFYESQLSLFREHLQLWQQTTGTLLGRGQSSMDDIRDRRFRHEAWNDSSYFDYLRRSYLLNSRWIHDTVQHVPGLDDHTARKVEFFTRQYLDAVSPSNFLLTNPEVMQHTLETNGENLVRGLTHMLADVRRGNGKLRISMTDQDAFTLGETIACTPGNVVYENDLMQLIQYSPSTAQVYERPLLIVPAWINKYYVLDLRPQNSFVKWLVDQGYTVFMISWVNPDETLRHKRFDDYLAEGPLAALDVIETITGSDATSMIGYCLGGTLVAITLSYLRTHGQAERVCSATYLTTMVDYTNAGELAVFIDDEQLLSLEGRMSGKGYLEAADMSNTFSMLRANDLIWSFVVNNYLLGREPFPFDLLYWNSDSTRMPARMHSFYLRQMYQKNLLAKPGGIELLDTPINITKIETPSYILSTKDDHIAPWPSTYAATQIYDGPVTFVLAQSGHIAGVVSPPAKKKYGYWTNRNLPVRPQEWFAQARFHEAESWWPHWHQWQSAYRGGKVKARKPGGRHYPPIEDAPGAYARIQA